MAVAEMRNDAPERSAARSTLYQRSDNPPLRVGLLFLAGGLRPGYGVLLRALAACEAATVVCLLACALPGPAARAGAGRAGAAAAWHGRLDRRLVRRHRQAGDDPADPKLHFPAAETLACQAAPAAGRWTFAADTAGGIRALALDVLLALDRSDWSDELATLARHGLWHFGWNGQGAGDLDHVLFDRLRRAQPLIDCQLRRRLGVADPTIARMAVAAHPRSLTLSRDGALRGAALLASRALRGLRGTSLPPVEAGAAPESLPRPGPWAVADLAARQVWRWLRFRRQYRRGEWWFLAVRALSGPAAAGEWAAGFRPLPSAPGRYCADPFLIEQDGKTHLFFEDFDRALGRGRISHAVLGEEGMPGPVSPVLERPYHLSYPFVFRWRGQNWMVPETGANRAVELYRAESFPLRWSIHRTLLQGWKAVDATLHEDDAGRWWMFVHVSEDSRGAGALFLFMADSPLGPWRPHPANPVQSDVRHARPGGRLFYSEGRLLRPAQDCSQRYGGALWLMEVTALTAASYGERPLRRLDPLPLPGNLCLHHRDATARFEFVDGMRLRPARR